LYGFAVEHVTQSVASAPEQAAQSAWQAAHEAPLA
jgi:hypothetical protein